MFDKRLNRQIFNLAVPNILSNLSVPLLSSVDTALVGHLPSPIYIGAVAIGSMIFNFVYWGFGFLRMGTTGLTAQAYGKQDHADMRLQLWRALFFALGAGILLIVTQDLIAYFAFYLIDASPEVEKFANIYFRIRIYAAPATLALYAVHGWFLGMQNARLPLIITVTINFLNIVFNLIFVLQLKMTSDGVALGTLLAQYAGVFLSFFFLIRHYKPYVSIPSFKDIVEWLELTRFFKVNFNLFIRTLSLLFAFSFFTAQSAKLGDIPLAANSVLIQLWMIFAYGIDGFAFAAESLVGKFLGANDRKNLARLIKQIFILGSGLGLLISIVYGFFDRQIAALFTSNRAVLNTIAQFMPWTIVAPFLNSFCYIWDGIYIGATATRALRNAMLLAIFGVYLPLHYLLTPVFGNHGMWAALLSLMIFRTVTLTYLSPKHLKIHIKTIFR
ncbi:MATE efflux family protein [Caldithrix abyssi DSM 13497]|uniref:MATE efflux family protein n=1 Tax=Caldithrix abyssi DSM 13497 TaxID=880073 RepID=H1XXN8_CALAY|nr:MATE family efflux transporter [Caldithrix abyssi]APF19251.1 multidrug resistance protein, MATE family [Caldithrix abyssi DSM 13497]EHO43162.1 MATE efflux family protein [Caldithrix abyssi DSM 13497]